MPEDEQIRRNAAMLARLRRYDVVKWANDFIHSLHAVKAQQRQQAATRCDARALQQIQAAAASARRRLLLLDYDGTLVPFAETPEAAQPTAELLRVLEQLAADPRNHVVVISGRDRHSLGAWLADLAITLIAEHGVWIRAWGEDWSARGAPAQAWKAELRPLLERYVDHVPGSAIEEKEFGLVWHYRKVEANLGARKAKELLHELGRTIAALGLEVLPGNKVVEVRNPAFHKGATVRQLIAADPADFILALGDDWTDEDMFTLLPTTAFSIKVGSAPTAARWHLGAQSEVLPLLAAICQAQ
jgi:trehalose 6-phosphate synthase/phosphatase